MSTSYEDCTDVLTQSTSIVISDEDFEPMPPALEVEMDAIYSPMDIPTKKKRSKSERLFEVIKKYKVTSSDAMKRVPLNEKEEFLSMPIYNLLVNSYTNALSQQLLCDKITLPLTKKPEYTSSKIYDLLLIVHRWSTQRIAFFHKIIFDVLNRKTGKKNCIWLHGISNSGKSQLFTTLLHLVCRDRVGVPISSNKTQFQFGNCVDKRVILWEEPVIDNINIEAVKCLFGGDALNVDVKYERGVWLHKTPIFVTSNKAITAGMAPETSEQLLNRTFTFELVGDPKAAEKYMPLSDKDWIDFNDLMHAC